jgi:glycosyltransferase involved in cell wall biosynthesis
LKLLLATDVTVRGGVDGYVRDLAAAYRQSGHEVAVLLEETTTSALRDILPDQQLDLRFAAQYHRRHHPDRIRAESAKVLAGVAPDGVHVVCGSPQSCLGLREVAAARECPIIITEQQIDDRLVLADLAGTRIRASYTAARHVVFVSEGNRLTMERLIGLDGVATSVIPNGVDVARITAQAAAFPPRARTGGATVLAAARFAPEKCLDVLVRAVSALPPSLVARADLYGDGPERDALARLVAQLDLGSRVIIRPWAHDVVSLMAAYDLFVLPSRAEGMPYVVLEAMAAGIPVVATDVAGTAEALADGAAGLLARQQDAAALAAAIGNCVMDPAETAKRARTARARAGERYNLPLQMRRMVALWE